MVEIDQAAGRRLDAAKLPIADGYDTACLAVGETAEYYAAGPRSNPSACRFL